MKFAVLLAGVASSSAFFPPFHGSHGFPSLFPQAASNPIASSLLCNSSSSCPLKMQCRLRPGECTTPGATGTCMPVMPICLFESDPVCGCDGQTYKSSCSAYKAGTNVASLGACGGGGLIPKIVPQFNVVPFLVGPHAGPPASIGHAPLPTCHSDGDCVGRAFCQQFVCNASGIGAGTCVNVPDICTLQFSPVCGCDGITYPSECNAARGRVDVKSRGPCPIVPGTVINFPSAISVPGVAPAITSIPEPCGGFIGRPCKNPKALCVNIGVGICFGADLPGTCIVPDAVADCGGPVCGCRGKTFANKCEAWKSGDTIATLGPCIGGIPSSIPSILNLPRLAPVVPTAVLPLIAPVIGASDGSCDDNEDCADDEFCKQPDTQCGNEGTCHKKPKGRECASSPAAAVCGCDGGTYNSPCEAYMAGTSVSGFGRCDANPVGSSPIGQSCNDDTECPEAFYCDTSASECGRLDGIPGSCTEAPSFCDDVPPGKPQVCGCDGNYYKSVCKASQEGVGTTTDTDYCSD